MNEQERNKIKSLLKEIMLEGITLHINYGFMFGISKEELEELINEIIREEPSKYRWISLREENQNET